MKVTAKLDAKGFEKKLKNLRNLNMMFQQLASHVLNFFMDEMVDWELNFNPVGRISGNLANSPFVYMGNYNATLKMNVLAPAPYNRSVNTKIEKRFGKGYMELTWARIQTVVLETIASEWSKAITTIERGGNYTYHNPFYS